MRNVREQLYATKVALLAVLFTFVGLLALVAGAVPSLPHGWHWLHESVTQNIAMALFTTGLVVVAFTYIDGKDKETRDAERIGNAVVDKAPAIVQAVLDGLPPARTTCGCLPPTNRTNSSATRWRPDSATLTSRPRSTTTSVTRQSVLPSDGTT